jgi:hypothetical protein
MLSHGYQGNAWWIAWAVFVLFLLSQSILDIRRKRKAGFPIDPRAIIRACLFFLGFVAIAIYQVLTHQ